MIIKIFQFIFNCNSTIVKLDFKNPAFIFIYKYKYIYVKMKNLNIFSSVTEYETAKSGGY